MEKTINKAVKNSSNPCVENSFTESIFLGFISPANEIIKVALLEWKEDSGLSSMIIDDPLNESRSQIPDPTSLCKRVGCPSSKF